MKKLFSFFTLLFLALILTGCGETEATTETIEAPETLEISEVDEYLFNEEFQFVDLRNFDDQMSDGWIRGFEIIPFFQYLEYENILVRSDGWSFDESQILDEGALRALFDEDKYIVLICAGGTRAGYVKEALEHLGYEHVYNVGGLSDYEGDNRVFGDGSFSIELPHRAMVDALPETIDMGDEFIDYYAKREDVMFVDLRNLIDGMTLGLHKESNVIPFFEYLEQENILVRVDGWTFTEEAIVDEEALRNIFDEESNIILFCASGTRAEFVKEALEHLGYENVWNAGSWSDYSGSLIIDPEGACDEETNDDNGGC
ncbi:MAG: rhodanese-like domain-containing protein [Candidatus Izemoplasmataceae bacterium]